MVATQGGDASRAEGQPEENVGSFVDQAMGGTVAV